MSERRYYFKEVLDRIVEMEKLAITTPSGEAPVAVPYGAYAQNVYPYWINGIGDVRLERPSSGSSVRRYMVIMRLIIGTVNQDYIGENEAWGARWIEEVLDYFEVRPMLQRFDGDSIPQFLHEGGVSITRCSGIIYTPAFEGSVLQSRIEFELDVPLRVRRDLIS